MRNVEETEMFLWKRHTPSFRVKIMVGNTVSHTFETTRDNDGLGNVCRRNKITNITMCVDPGRASNVAFYCPRYCPLRGVHVVS